MTIIVAAVSLLVTALGLICFALFVNNNTIVDRNKELKEQVDRLKKLEKEREINDAYHLGLHNARETDALYRGFLSKVEKGEQATMMMHGQKGPINEQ